jgi:hypothetical protein
MMHGQKNIKLHIKHCYRRDSNGVPSEYKSEALTLESSWSSHNSWSQCGVRKNFSGDPVLTYDIIRMDRLAPELGTEILAHSSCTPWQFYEPKNVTVWNTRHFVSRGKKRRFCSMSKKNSVSISAASVQYDIGSVGACSTFVQQWKKRILDNNSLKRKPYSRTACITPCSLFVG